MLYNGFMEKKLVTMQWSVERIAAVDAERGKQSRSEWLWEAAEARLGSGTLLPVAAPQKPAEKPSGIAQDFKKVAGLSPASEIKPPENRCPNPSCSFRAPSPHARCPIHPGKLVPA